MLETNGFLNNLSILLVEDEVIISHNMAISLRYHFKEVYVAQNGLEALDLYHQKMPDIILSDIRMSDMDGLAFAEQVRKKDYQIPIVFITSYSDRETLLKAAKVSIDGYLIKPVNQKEMLKTLTAACKRNRQLDTKIVIAPNTTYDIFTKELTREGQIVELGTKESLLLKLFAKNISTPLDKQMIAERIYPLDSVGDSAIKNLITRLREKIGEESIFYIKGAGWKLRTEN